MGSVNQGATKLLFEYESNPGGVKPRPNAIARTSAAMAEAADFFGWTSNFDS